MKKIKRMLSAGLAVCCLGGLVFTAAADTFTNGTYFSKYFTYQSAQNLVNGNKTTSLPYSGVMLINQRPQSLYVKVASQSNGGGLDYCPLTHVIQERGQSKIKRLNYNYSASTGTAIWLRAVNQNQDAATYSGTGYLN